MTSQLRSHVWHILILWSEKITTEIALVQKVLGLSKDNADTVLISPCSSFYRAEIRSAQLGAEQTILSHAILSHASLSVYMLQQHMAVTCCQGSLSPGLASPARGQMAAHWALKSKTALLKTVDPLRPSYLGSSRLPGGLFSLHPLVTCQGSSLHWWFNLASIQAECKRKKWKWKKNVPVPVLLLVHG